MSALSGLRRIDLRVERISGVYLLVLFIVVFGIWSPDVFLTSDTAHTIASQQSISGILALAVLVSLVCGAYDLSVGSVTNLTAILVATLQTRDHVSMPMAIAISVAVGLTIGAVNGFVVVRLKVNSFICTLGTATLIGAVQTMVTNGSQPLGPSSPTWAALTQHMVFGFQVVVVYLLVLAVILWWVLAHTPVGRYAYAAGSNQEAARLSGVAVGRWTWLSLTVGGGLAGIAGVLYCSLNGPSLTFGGSLLLPAFAAVFLGSTQFTPGRANVWGTMLAIVVLATGVQGLQIIYSVQWLNDLFSGSALIIAVAVAGWRQRAASNRRRRERVPTASPPHDRVDGAGPPEHEEIDEPLGDPVAVAQDSQGSPGTHNLTT